MRRNRAAVLKRHIERAAVQAVQGAVAQGAPAGSLGGMALAGAPDPATGEWEAFGLLDVTPLGDFLLSG